MLSSEVVTLLTLLGSTGSIGTSTLDVVERWPGRFGIYALVAGRNVELLARQIAKFKPQVAVVADEDALLALRRILRENGPREPLLAAAGLVAINPFAAFAAVTHPLAASVSSLGTNLLASGIAAYCRSDRLHAGKEHQEHLANPDILRLIRIIGDDLITFIPVR